MEPENLDNSERSRCREAKTENKQKLRSKIFNDFTGVHWIDNGYGWPNCGVCGYTKLTAWQAETFKGEKILLCDDCKTAWEKQQEKEAI